MNEDAPPGLARATTRGLPNRPQFDPSLYDPTFVPPPRAVAPVDSARQPYDQAAAPGKGDREERNGLATASLAFGLGAAVLPVLAVPGVVLGIAALRRVKQAPSLPGRERALAGIITSLLLGAVSLVVLVVIATGGG